MIVTPTAQRHLETLIRTHSLPASTGDRFRNSIDQLRRFPLIGAQLPGRWSNFRFVLGPWRWMIVIYRYYEGADEVRIIGVQDARAASSATSTE